MFRNHDVLFVSVFACCLLCPAVAEEKKTQEIKGWGEAVDPDGDCKFVEKKGMVTISIPGTYHDLNPTPAFNNVSGPRVLQEVEGDFVMEVKVLAYPLPKPKTATKNTSYVGAGLLIWSDDKNFIRLFRAGNGDSARFFKSAEIFTDAKFVPYGMNVGLEDKATFLRLERMGDKLTQSMSDDGKKWAEDSTAEVKLPKKLKAGLAAVNSTTSEFAPQFEEFKLTKK